MPHSSSNGCQYTDRPSSAPTRSRERMSPRMPCHVSSIKLMLPKATKLSAFHYTFCSVLSNIDTDKNLRSLEDSCQQGEALFFSTQGRPLQDPSQECCPVISFPSLPNTPGHIVSGRRVGMISLMDSRMVPSPVVLCTLIARHSNCPQKLSLHAPASVRV